MPTKKNDSKADTKTSHCWPGFEPVPGKSEHEQGSCRKKPASRNGGKEPDRETSRKKQVALGGKRAEQAKAKSPDAAERKSVSKTKKAPAKKTAATRTKSAAQKSSRPGTKAGRARGQARRAGKGEVSRCGGA